MNVPSGGVLTNDTGMFGTNLTATLVSGPAHGELVLTNNGGFAYTPAAGYSGTDSFIYQASDGVTNVGTAIVTLTVVGSNPVSEQFSITSISASNGVMTVRWYSIVGRTYRVQYKQNLTDSSWTDLPGDVTATGDTSSKSDLIGNNPRRFYRVIRMDGISDPHPPIVASLGISNGIVTIQWNSISGRTYKVQYKQGLSDADWTDLPP